MKETTWKRPRYRWEGDNIKMDLKEVGWGGVEWIIWLRIGTGGWCLCTGNEPSGSIKCTEYRD